MHNLRFSTALHILVLLDYINDQWLTSEFISGSINVNSSVVRKEVSALRNAGIIISKQGKEGGSKLAKNSNEIYLDEIYKVVQNSQFFGKMNQPNPACEVGKLMNSNLENLYTDLESEILNKLNKISLKTFSNQFKK